MGIITIYLVANDVSCILSLLISMFFVTLYSLMDIIRLVFGKPLHKTMVTKEIFTHLKYDKFQIEHMDEYYGMIGCINNRTVRIFFDWEKIGKGYFSPGDIVIEIFYEPFVNNVYFYQSEAFGKFIWEKTNVLNFNRLHLLPKKIKHFFWNDRLILNMNYYPWMKTIDIKEAINIGIDILAIHNFKPFDIRRFPVEIYKKLSNYGAFLPYMNFTYKYIGDSNNPYIQYQKI